MSSARPLRLWLAPRIVLAGLVPLAVVAALVLGVLLPQLRADLEIRYQTLARAIAGQIEIHLLGAGRELRAIAQDLRDRGDQPPSSWFGPLDAHAGTGDVFAAIYITDPNDAVYSVGLPQAERGQRGDLLELDLSKWAVLREARERNQAVWSETFLSAVTGRLAVTLAIPVAEHTLVGEIAIDRLSEFVGRSPAESGMVTMILDRRGQIIAHSRAALSGQQISLGHLPIVRDALEGFLATRSFELDGERLVGTPVGVPQLGWVVLVAQPRSEAFRPFWSTLWVLATGALVALLLAILVALALARGFARRIGRYAEQAHAIAEGDYDQPWPVSHIREFDGLAGDLDRMSLAIRQRERDLATSEARFRSVIGNAPVVLFQFDEHGIFTFSEGKGLAGIGLAAGEVVGQSVFELYRDYPEVCDYARRALDGESVRFNTPIRDVFLDVYANPVRDGGGHLQVMGVTVDITERQRAEEALRQANLVVENSPAMLFRWKAEDGWPVAFVSHNVTQLGYSPEELLDGSFRFASLVYPEDLERIGHELRGYSERGVDQFQQEYRIVAKDGTLRWVDDRTVVERNSRGEITHYQGIVIDITERKRAEEALRLTQFAVDRASVAVCWAKSDGRYQYVNDEMCRSLGYSREELLAMSVLDVNAEFTPEHWRTHWRELKAKRALALESKRRAKNGRIFPIELFVNYFEYGGEGYSVAFIRDITERKQAEEAIRASEEKYRLLVDHQTDLIVKVDPDNRFLYVSPSYCQTFGKTEEELLGQTFMPLVHEEDRESTAKAMEDLFRPPYRIYLEQRALTQTGWRWFGWADTAMLNDQGQVVAIIGAGRDITERKRAEEALRRSNRQLRMLSDCNQALIRITDEMELLTTICTITVREGGYRMAWVGYAEQDASKTIRPMAHAGFEEGYLQNLSITWADDERGLGPMGTAIRTGRPGLVQNIASDSRFSPWRAEAAKRGYAAVCALPLTAGDQIVGALGIYSSVPDAFDAEEIDLLSELASDLAFGIAVLRTRIEREQANRALKESEFFLRKSQEVGDLGSYYFDARTGTWISSEKLDQIFGIDGAFPKTVNGWIEVIHPDDREEMLQYLTDHVLAKHNKFDKEYRIVRHDDGQERWVHGLGELEFDEGGVPIKMIGTIQDISQSKRADEALRASEALLAKTTADAPAMIYQFLLRPDGTSCFPYASAWCWEMFGVPPEALRESAAPLLDRILPEDRPGFEESVACSARTLEPWRHEYRLRSAREDIVWHQGISRPERQADGSILWSGIFFDTTERKRAEEELCQSEKLSQLFIQYAPTAIAMFDREIRYIAVSNRWISDYHLRESDLLGKSHYEIFPEISDQLKEIHQRGLNGEIVKSDEDKFKRADGSIQWLRWETRPWHAADGSIGGLVIFSEDITERKRAEEELQRYREHLEELVAERTAELRQAMDQLVQAEKLAALGHLVAGVAHELNTPLGNARVVAGSLGETLREFEAGIESGGLRRSQLETFLERGREAVDLLERNAARAADLIGHFKQVAVDQSSARRRRFDLRQTVEELLATLQPQFKRTAHRVELDIPPDIELDSYPGPLEQVLANLVGNSLTHGFAGIDAGVIRIGAAARDDGHAQIDYADDGVGIPEAILNRIFEPFFTTRLGQGGSGLGLYIVYNLVTGVLGGGIEARARPGGGAAFTLRLPRKAPDQTTLGIPSSPWRRDSLDGNTQ